MRVVVTGGAGFIGSRIARAYVARGARVSVLDDLSGGDPAAVPDGADLVVADVADAAIVPVLAALRADLVVHAAAQVSVARSVADPERDQAVNVAGTANTLAGARAGGARRFVLLSSGGAVYGEADGATERRTPRPRSPYGQHKLAAERLVAAAGPGYAIARLSNVYGPGQRADLEGGVVAIFSDRLRAGLPLEIHGDGRQRRDLLYVDDAVEAITAMGAAALDGTWNVATGIGITILELAARLQRRLGPAAGIVAGPRRVGDVRVSRLAIGRIRRDLGWSPRHDLDAGLEAMLAGAGALDSGQPTSLAGGRR